MTGLQDNGTLNGGGERPVQTICLLILTAVAVGAALHLLRAVLLPFVLALFLAITLMPLVELLMRRLRFPRVLAVTTVLLVSIAALGLLGVLVSYSIADFASDPEAYQKPLEQLLRKVADVLRLEELGDRLSESQPASAPADSAPAHADLSQPASQLATAPVSRQPGSQGQDPLRSLMDLTSGTVTDFAVAATGAVTSLLSQGVLVLILLCFMLYGGSTDHKPLTGTWAEAVRQTQRYIIVKTGLSLATGVLTAVVLYAYGVRMALVFGLLAFLLNFIPSIGSIAGTLLPLPVVLLDPDIPGGQAVVIIGILAVVQFVIGNIIETRMMGKSFDLHAITIMLALIFWGVLWGIVGMFLAVPITAIARVFLARSELTAPVARLMSGRLGPSQSQTPVPNPKET